MQRGVLYAKVRVSDDKHLQLYTLHTQCTNVDYAANYIPVVRGVRDITMEEVVELLDETMDGRSTAILSGDFNITRYPLNQILLGRFFALAPDIAGYIGVIESEYDGLVETLRNRGKFNVADCWLRDNDSSNKQVSKESEGGFDPYCPRLCITFGDTRAIEGTQGLKESEREPLETMQTVGADLYYHNCLDYVFQISRKGGEAPADFKVSNTRVEKQLA